MHRSKLTRLTQYKPNASIAWVIFGILVSYLLVISALGVLTGQ